MGEAMSEERAFRRKSRLGLIASHKRQNSGGSDSESVFAEYYPVSEIEEDECYIKDPTNTVLLEEPSARAEESLLLAILQQALEDIGLKRSEVQMRGVSHEDWWDAVGWVFTENHEPFGFDWVVNSLPRLNSTPDELRRRVGSYACPYCGIRVLEKPCKCIRVNK